MRVIAIDGQRITTWIFLIMFLSTSLFTRISHLGKKTGRSFSVFAEKTTEIPTTTGSVTEFSSSHRRRVVPVRNVAFSEKEVRIDMDMKPLGLEIHKNRTESNKVKSYRKEET